VILAANHGSYIDPFFLAMPVRRNFCFMAKAEVFRPLSWRLLAALGAFPVRRGAQDEETFATAEAVIARGGGVVVFPDGGIYRGGEIGVRPRAGVGRLSLESGAPVVPAAIRGSCAVGRFRFPRVEVVYGAPRRFGHEIGASHARHQEVADAVYAEIRRLYRERHSPGARRCSPSARSTSSTTSS
jgi:1-acyl-sn-glycerol-3-phosphate acyltransferase